MKKSTLCFLISFLMFAAYTNAQQTLNNPKDEDGYYIVKWDCAEDDFAASNDIEVDESFTFAVDVTGTPWEEWLKADPTSDSVGATRGLAINKWTGFGDFNGATNRLKRIKENIYGATWNMVQMANSLDVEAATTVDAATFVTAQVFGYEYNVTNPGLNWWMWVTGISEGSTIKPKEDVDEFFKTLPYTGTKTGDEFWSDDYEGGFALAANASVQGYTVPCALYVPTSVRDDIKTDSKVIGHEYYNVMGQRLPKEPLRGMYFDKMLKEDGTFVVIKKINIREK